MPLSRYDKAFGGKRGSASKAHAAMTKQYGAKKGEQVFYATKNKRQGSTRQELIRQFMRKHRGSRGRSKR